MEDDKHELMEQMRRFKEEAHKQQQDYQQQLERSIEKVVDILNTVHNQMKSNQRLIEINHMLSEAEQQFVGITTERNEEDKFNGTEDEEYKRQQWSED